MDQKLKSMDQGFLDELIQRVGVGVVLDVVADHILFRSARMRRKRDLSQNQDVKASYRKVGRELERISYKVSELASRVQNIENVE